MHRGGSCTSKDKGKLVTKTIFLSVMLRAVTERTSILVQVGGVLRGLLYIMSTVGGGGGSPKRRRKEQNQLICDSDK